MAAPDVDIIEPEQLSGLSQERRPHLHGRRGRLRIDSALMRNAHHEIEVTHRLAEETGRYGVERQFAPLALVCEDHFFERQPLDLGGGEEGLLKTKSGCEPLLVKGASHAFFGTCHPAAATKQRERLT